MGKTSIDILEEFVVVRETPASGGDIAYVLAANRGRHDKVYVIDSVSKLKQVYGEGTTPSFTYANYLLSRGNVLKIIRPSNANDGTQASVSVPSTSPFLTVKAIADGTGYNNIKIVAESQGGATTENIISLAVVDSDGYTLEYYPKVSLNPQSPYYYGLTVTSDIITIEWGSTEYSAQVWTPGAYTLANGTDGSGAVNYSGAISYFENRELDITSLILPEVSADDAVEATEDLFVARQDLVLILDAAANATASAAKSEFTELESDYLSYMAGYYPRVRVNGFSEAVPSAVLLADLIGNLHRNKLWYKAPAGLTNGILTDAIDVVNSLTKTEIGDLQDANVNPIVVKESGVAVWGQSTLNTSNLDITRLSVRLLTNYFKRNVYRLSQQFMFADNNEYTWDQWINAVEPIIRDIYNVGGIRAYRVICDTSIMTEEDIRNGIMRGQVIFIPISQIEKIVITFSIDETGVSIA